MTYKECLDDLPNYRKYWGKKVEFEKELYIVKHPLICPKGGKPLGLFIKSYIKESKSIEISLAPYLTGDLQIVLEAIKISNDTPALLELSGVSIVNSI